MLATSVTGYGLNTHSNIKPNKNIASSEENHAFHLSLNNTSENPISFSLKKDQPKNCNRGDFENGKVFSVKPYDTTGPHYAGIPKGSTCEFVVSRESRPDVSLGSFAIKMQNGFDSNYLYIYDRNHKLIETIGIDPDSYGAYMLQYDGTRIHRIHK